MPKQNELERRLQKLEEYLQDDIKTIIGVEAVNHFKQSFDDEGFTDKTLEKWEQVERREPKSVWYGFRYDANSTLPNNHPKRRGAKGAYKRRKPDSKTNFSKAATKAPILTQTGSLADSIDWKKTSKGVEISANTPYAQVQNEGGMIKIFGGKPVQLEARPFMGESKALNDKIAKMIENDLQKMMK